MTSYAPYRRPESWTGPYDYDENWHAQRYKDWGDNQPTRAMFAHALPEGVLADGGEVEGLVYFYELPEPPQNVRFEMELFEARSGERVGEVGTPLLIQQDDPDLARTQDARDDG